MESRRVFFRSSPGDFGAHLVAPWNDDTITTHPVTTAGQETGRERRLWLFPGWCRITRPGTYGQHTGPVQMNFLESRWCPIFKATGLLVLGVKLPNKKIGHLTFQVFCFLKFYKEFWGVITCWWNKHHALPSWKLTYPYISHFGKKGTSFWTVPW